MRVIAMSIIHVEIAGRKMAAVKAEYQGQPAWLLAGERSAQYVALPNPHSAGLLVVFYLGLNHQPFYGLELRESGSTLVVHRHPGGHLAPSVGARA
jgi:hypothetical protein